MVRISRIFIAYIIVYLICVWFAFSLCKVDLINLASMWKMTLLLTVVAAFLSKSERLGIELTLVLSLYVILFCTGQFFLFLVAPERIAPNYTSILSADSISSAITYILLGTTVVGLGFLAGSRAVGGKGSHSAVSPMLPYSPRKTVIILIVSGIIMFVCHFIVGFGNVNIHPLTNFVRLFFGYLTLFFNDAIMLLIVFALFLQKHATMGRKLKGLMLAGVLLIAFLNLAGGSRGGLIRPVQYFILSAIALKGDFKMSTKLLVSLIAVILLSFAVFPLVTSVKYALHSGLRIVDTGTFFSLLGAGAETAKYDPGGLIVSGVNRLNGIAPVTGILAVPRAYFSEVITFSGNVKYLVNTFIPFSQPFADAVSSARLFNVIVFDYSHAHILQNYQTTAYTGWGLAYAYFGWWGGLLALFLEAFALSALYQKAAKTKSKLNALLRVWIVVFTYGFFLGFGFDEQLVTHRIFLTTGIGYLVVMRFLDRGSFGGRLHGRAALVKTL